MKEESFEMIAKTLYGLEDVLAEELKALKAEEVQIGRRVVSFVGDKAMLYKANLHCRTAVRILKPLSQFKADNAETVYIEAKKIDWDSYFSTEQTFAVDAVIYSESFNHSKFVAYRTKDAIVDYFNEKCGQRPSVRINNPDMYIHIHISHHDCSISLDSSGESLHKRGYRVEQVDAPLNEVLAAGMILKTGWRGATNFVDPMCGSGTLLIEAAMIALNIPPGLYRQEYAFERWIDFDRELFEEVCKDESGEREFMFRCYGSDISPKALEKARKNIDNAGLSRYIELKTLPFQKYSEAPKEGILITNPPYGERISADDIMNLYAMIGERLKHAFAGYQAWILSYKDECFDKIGLRPSQKMKLMNGRLECEYRCYELFKGKNKEYKTKLNEQTRFDGKMKRERAPLNEEKRFDGKIRKERAPLKEEKKRFDGKVKRERAPLKEEKKRFDGKVKRERAPLNEGKRFDRDRKESRKPFVKDKDKQYNKQNNEYTNRRLRRT